jgi:hypothetical protein
MESRIQTVSMLNPVAATNATFTQDFLAANSKELYYKMAKLVVDGDKEAWMSLVKKGLLDGSIIWIYKDDKVYSEGCEVGPCSVVEICLPSTTGIYYTAIENIKHN